MNSRSPLVIFQAPVYVLRCSLLPHVTIALLVVVMAPSDPTVPWMIPFELRSLVTGKIGVATNSDEEMNST